MNKPTFEANAPLILIVDDDRTMRGLLKIAMEAEGYRTVEAKNGQECLVEYERTGPHMVLLDALMPEMDGFTCCQKLRSLEGSQDIPVLMITALDDQDSIDKAFEAGATDFITKPIFWSVLSHRVGHLLVTSQKSRELNCLQTQSNKQQQWQQLWNEIMSQWQLSASVQSLYNNFLDQLRSLVDAQRAGIYRLDGKLIAQAIASGYPSVKSVDWKAMTLWTEYQKTYEEGNEVIIDFSQDTGLSEDITAPFEQLTLKTLTLMPLFVKDQIWGILWIHHCQSSHVWRSWELPYLKYLRDVVPILRLTVN